MGDRCWLSITVRKRDFVNLCEEVGEDPLFLLTKEQAADESDKPLYFDFDEANYGWYTELHAAADRGCAFYGGHGAGGEYGDAAFCASNKNIIWIETDQDGTPTVPMSRDGVSEEAVSAVRDYYALFDTTKRLVASNQLSGREDLELQKTHTEQKEKAWGEA